MNSKTIKNLKAGLQGFPKLMDLFAKTKTSKIEHDSQVLIEATRCLPPADVIAMLHKQFDLHPNSSFEALDLNSIPADDINDPVVRILLERQRGLEKAKHSQHTLRT